MISIYKVIITLLKINIYYYNFYVTIRSLKSYIKKVDIGRISSYSFEIVFITLWLYQVLRVDRYIILTMNLKNGVRIKL